MDTNDLSEEQIEQLLQQAEVRLRGGNALVSSDVSIVGRPARTQLASIPAPPMQSKGSVARVDPESLVKKEERQLASYGIRKVEAPIQLKRKQLKAKKASAGEQWFDLPKTDLTPQLKRDLQVIRMRSVLDPHRHYKKDNSKPAVPEFSQVGTMQEGPTEYFSARIPKNDRHKTLAETVMAGEKDSGRMKRKYAEIQEKKTSGKKGHYRKMMEKRYKGKMK